MPRRLVPDLHLSRNNCASASRYCAWPTAMVLKCEPIFAAVETIWPERRADQKVVLLSAQGRLFDQPMAQSGFQPSLGGAGADRVTPERVASGNQWFLE